MPIFVTSKPFINPANIPSDVAKTKEIKKFPSVEVKSIPNVKDVIPTIEGKERSISPKVTTKVAEIAMIPKKGIDCIKAL